MKSLAIFTLLSAAAISPVSAQFSALPGVLHLDAADSAQTSIVQVRNEGESPLEFRIYLGDYDQAEDGDYDFMTYGTHAGSCTGRLAHFPDNAVLRPGEVQDIQVSMEGGAACWALLFIESAPSGAGEVRVAQRIGVRVLNSPATLSREGAVSEVAVHTDSALAVEFRFRNGGEAPVEVRGAVEIRDLAGSVVATSAVGPIGVLPSHVRHLRVGIEQTLPAGRYLAVPVLDFGGDYLAGGQAIFEVR